MIIYQANQTDLKSIVGLALQLWPDNVDGELLAEFQELIAKEDAAIFWAEEEAVEIGFAQVGLRHDYVEGTSSNPVGYLEGIFVVEEYRSRGVASKLLTACEQWARDKGCLEFASDCEIDNLQSLQFHMNQGFSEANRIICFTKNL